jgi:hypothetical protein
MKINYRSIILRWPQSLNCAEISDESTLKIYFSGDAISLYFVVYLSILSVVNNIKRMNV